MNSKTYHELKQKRFFVVRPEQIVLVEITTGHKAKTRSGCYHLTLPLKRQDGGNTVKELAKLKFQPTSAGYRLDRCFRTEDEKLNGTGNPLEAYLQHLDTASGKQHRITDAGVVPAWVLEGIREDVCRFNRTDWN